MCAMGAFIMKLTQLILINNNPDKCIHVTICEIQQQVRASCGQEFAGVPAGPTALALVVLCPQVHVIDLSFIPFCELIFITIFTHLCLTLHAGTFYMYPALSYVHC